ncbi:hypothetical protein TMatcc_002761 [Talaromyces marneffei ATCC 18224]
MSNLCTGLNKHKPILLRLLLALRGGNFPLVVQISLISNKHNNHIVASFASNIVYPFFCILERFGVGDVVHDDSDTRVTDIGGDEGSETFLAGCVPELQSNCSVFEALH